MLSEGFFMRLSDDFFDDSQFVCVSFAVHVVNAAVVQAVDAYFSVCVDDVIVFHDDAHMGDDTFLVVKKCQVSRFTFFNKAQGFSLSSLLGSISQECVSVEFVNHLCKS